MDKLKHSNIDNIYMYMYVSDLKHTDKLIINYVSYMYVSDLKHTEKDIYKL